MVREVYVHNIGVLLPSGASSTITKMRWRYWKSLLPFVLSFFLGCLLTRWLFCHSTQMESAPKEITERASSAVSRSFHDGEPDATAGVTTPFITPTLPPYPVFVGNQEMILSPNICRDDTFLLIVVLSSSRDLEGRNAIRSSWGRSLSADETEDQSSYKVIFSVGCDDASDTGVEKEAYEKGDILRGNFQDAYLQNEFHTMKTLAALKWATSLCSSTKYILKVSSESFVNIPQTVSWLRSLSQDSGQPYKAGLYAGLCHGANNEGPAPVRDPQSMWYIPESYWSDPHLPVYASSVGIVFSVDVAGQIASTSTEIRLTHIEDVYLGILAQRLTITCIDESSRFDTSYSTMLTECEDLHFCVIGSVPAKDMHYLKQNVANLRELCQTK